MLFRKKIYGKKAKLISVSNKSNFKGLIGLFFIVLTCSCKSLSSDKQPVCNESIQVSIFDSSIITTVADYRLYEVTTYPEGIIMKLETVAERHKYKDSSGVACLPLLKECSKQMVRKFVLVKDGYVYTLYYLKNRTADTLLNAIRVAPYKLK